MFKVPLQSEVEIYIKSKKNWPDEFVKYYTDRFWNFYQSNGWKVSGKAAMKDWKAAFNSQWQTLKFKEDIEMFNKCKPAEVISKKHSDQNLNYINDVMMEYKVRYDSIKKETLAHIYDYLKTQKLLILTKEQCQELKQIYSGREMEGKAACVAITFQTMITNGKHF